MKIIYALILCAVGVLCFVPCFGAVNDSDELNILLCEYKNNVKTGDYIHLDFNIWKWNGTTVWRVTEEWFAGGSDVDTDRNTSVLLEQSSSESDRQTVENIKWEPSKSLECDIRIYGELIHLSATKVKGTRHGWKVLMKGTLKETKAMPTVSWEFKKVDVINLKYPSLVLPEAFREK